MKYQGKSSLYGSKREGGRLFIINQFRQEGLEIFLSSVTYHLTFLKILFIYFKRKEGEREHLMVASCMPPTRDLALNPGMSHWESNQRPFALQNNTQTTYQGQSGLTLLLSTNYLQNKITNYLVIQTDHFNSNYYNNFV